MIVIFVEFIDELIDYSINHANLNKHTVVQLRGVSILSNKASEYLRSLDILEGFSAISKRETIFVISWFDFLHIMPLLKIDLI